MTYRRVVPRDLFNEASLLKCWGRLVILLTESPEPHAAKISEHDGGRFMVEQDESDGSIYLVTPHLIIGGPLGRPGPVLMSRPLNSREPWPLYCRPSMLGDFFEEVAVFTDEGELTPEFARLIRGNDD